MQKEHSTQEIQAIEPTSVSQVAPQNNIHSNSFMQEQLQDNCLSGQSNQTSGAQEFEWASSILGSIGNSGDGFVGPVQESPDKKNKKNKKNKGKKGKKGKGKKGKKNKIEETTQLIPQLDGLFSDLDGPFVGPIQEPSKESDQDKATSHSDCEEDVPLFNREDYSNDNYERETTPPFIAGYEGYAAFRVPTLVVKGSNDVFAFAEGRWDSHHDDQDCDIVMRSSRDGGKTWGDLVVVAEDGNNSVSGPSPVVLPNGDLIVLYGHQDLGDKNGEHQKEMYVSRSEDGGKTWSKENVTDQVKKMKKHGTQGYGAGPSQGLVKERNPNKGRLVIVAHQGSRAHLLLSDDFGQTFQIGAKMQSKSTEASVTEMGNGEIMINARSNGSDARRVGVSTDGGLTFSEERLDEGLYDRGIHSGLVFHSQNEDTGLDNLIFSNPDGVDHERTNGTLKLSMDGGKTWSRSVRYSDEDEAYSGYSNVEIINGGKDVAVIFERGGVGKDDYMDGKAVIENGTWEVDFEEGKDQLKERGKEDKRRYHMIDFKVIPMAAFFDDEVRESVENPESDSTQYVNNDSSKGSKKKK